MPAIVHEKPTIGDFVDLFLAALALRGKRSIWVRTDRAPEERQRMHALHQFICRAREENLDPDRRRFFVRLRNHTAPSAIGAFDNLQWSIFRKLSTIVDVDLTLCHSYDIALSDMTAQSYLERADPWLRKLAEDAADAYMAPDKKE